GRGGGGGGGGPEGGGAGGGRWGGGGRGPSGSRPACEVPAGFLPGRRAQGGGAIHPLAWDGRAHGALVVAWPSGSPATPDAALGAIAQDLALRFDHAVLAADVRALRAQAAQLGRGHEEKADEILKLSEALFAPDVELLRRHER